MISDHPLAHLTASRFREFLREPEAVFWVFVFPVLLAAGLGFAFQSRPQQTIRVAVTEPASTGSASLLSALAAESSLIAERLDDSAAHTALRTGRVALVVESRPNDSVSYRYDDTRPEARAARMLADASVQRARGRIDPVRVADTKVRERGSRYIDFVVPGLLGMNLMGSGIWGIGFGIVTARSRKLLKRLAATPMSRAHYLLSFLLFRLLLLVLEVGALVGFGVLVFGVPLRGSVAQLALICLISSLCFGAMGLLIASRARTVEGASGLMNLAMLPMWVASGVFFSASNFPDAVQPFIQALPLTAVNDALRANMLQGAGWSTVLPELAVVALWMTVSFALALKLFRWR
ncbi:MAG: ABC transporter permease [Anaerolineae bacterium]|nr:ABC transporter permease [Gemmatimonadaceae bacterium]